MNINNRGYWENPTAEGHGHDSGLARIITDLLLAENANNVIDMGCGDGFYSDYLNKNCIYCLGVDGNPYTKNLVRESPVVVADLSQPLQLETRFDWVLSLEVGEHIPKEYENSFFDNINKFSRKGVILSWATPGQGGDGHVNCKTNDEVISKMQLMSFVFDPITTQFLRDHCAMYPETGWWFRHTVMCFRR